MYNHTDTKETLTSYNTAEAFVQAFDYSTEMVESIIPRICDVLDINFFEKYQAIQILGDNDLEKHQLLSLLSLIADDSRNLEFVPNRMVKAYMQRIAGQYKVIRMELDDKKEFEEMITNQIDKHLKEWGVCYSFSEDNHSTIHNRFNHMMVAFEEKYPDKGLILIIDELNTYVWEQVDSPSISQDILVLQALGAMHMPKFRLLISGSPFPYQQEPNPVVNMFNRVIDHDFEIIGLYLQ